MNISISVARKFEVLPAYDRNFMTFLQAYAVVINSAIIVISVWSCPTENFIRIIMKFQRMSDNEMPRRIMECKPEGRRSFGRPGLRWKAEVEDDLRKLNVKNWWTVAKDRESWKKILREAEAHKGL
jgi:hypothetical protein